MLFNTLKNDEDAGAPFALPNVVGEQLDVASQMLQDLELTIKPVEEPTAGVAEGVVIRTDPIAETLVTKGQEITVVYNPIKAPVAIPDVTGKTVEEATALLTAAGFTVSPDTVFVEGSTLEPGKVLSTNPPFGESAVQGTVIILTVSKAPDQQPVPDVTGQTAEAAKALLEAEPYTFEVMITPEPNAEIAANTVLRTDPVVNTPVAKGSKVNVFVSAGPAKVKVPPVEGLTEAAARNQLTNRGLVPDVQYVIVAVGFARRWSRHLAEHSANRFRPARYNNPAEGRQGGGGADDHDSPDDDDSADDDHDTTDCQLGDHQGRHRFGVHRDLHHHRQERRTVRRHRSAGDRQHAVGAQAGHLDVPMTTPAPIARKRDRTTSTSRSAWPSARR